MLATDSEYVIIITEEKCSQTLQHYYYYYSLLENQGLGWTIPFVLGLMENL